MISHPKAKSTASFRALADAIHARLHQVKNEMPVPKSVQLSAWGDLAIEWPDGKKTISKPYTLRVLCACANCVDENTGQKKLAKTQVKSTNRAYGNETYLGLISRNLFPFYLSRYGSESKALKVLLPTRESRLNEHVRTLRHLREASVQSKSAWLAAAWLNYRNLYLLGVNGRAWCDQNLPLISPRVPTTGLADEAVSKAI